MYRRFELIKSHPELLKRMQRGIERESLRINPQGRLALTVHPAKLGAALTHPSITTDYSESLLELVTGTHHSVPELFAELQRVHVFVTQNMQSDESMWMHSMPCKLPAEPQIPIAWYGTSNSGMLKHVYRRGLAERYGKKMQCIAGIHYNFSLPSEVWEVLNFKGANTQEKQSTGYFALLRNFKRYSWMLMYLFGASPAMNRDFIEQNSDTLKELNELTSYMPYATSLRMSDFGYKDEAQDSLNGSFNHLDDYVRMMYKAVTKPWPPYQAIGTHRDGEWIQLNTNILQIENEFYSTIRPKRTTARGERPNTALLQKGVQYIEVRCLDIDPFEATGVSPVTCYFMDTFLLWCVLKDSHNFDKHGNCNICNQNFAKVVTEGRHPDLQLQKADGSGAISLQDWGLELLQDMRPVAALLDQALETNAHTEALEQQAQKFHDVRQTPSARFVEQLQTTELGFNELVLRNSLQQSQQLRLSELDEDVQQQFIQAAKDSIDAQKQLELNDDISFEEYLKRFLEELIDPDKAQNAASDDD
ncbi:glutamate--cysteine ligase [Brackiella oedipodis]|uniref:glutamate--cysteine ligase n=1 Tax=Brackiella oedipodis TaxID=124225 RepID=UPI0004910B1F|nr:glutamate--cysteine ligase [Brackiella oedipodis]